MHNEPWNDSIVSKFIKWTYMYIKVLIILLPFVWADKVLTVSDNIWSNKSISITTELANKHLE